VAQPAARKSVVSAPDLSGIEAELRRLGVGDEACGLVLGLLASMAQQNQALQQRLETALRQLWSRSSEKVSPDQLLLFLSKLPAEAAAQAVVETTTEAGVAGPASGDAGTDGVIAPPAPPQKPAGRHHGKRAFPPHLPRRQEKVSVAPEERQCACGKEMVCIGHETQVLWEYDPGCFFLLERLREKLACKQCEENGVTTAPAPGKPIEGGRPGPGLLAQIVTAKENDSQPLYRQSQIYKRSGIHLAPSTLGDWHAAAADLYEPIWRHLRDDTLRKSHLLSLDDTPMPVLDRDDARGVKKGHIWTYLGDERRVGFCDYTANWSGKAPMTLLADFKGKVVQGDGYAGIDAFFQGPAPPRRAGCHDHARRRFVKAMEAGDARAAIVVALYRDLYAIEKEARHDKLDADSLLLRRQERSRPVMERLRRVIADLHAASVPKSPMGKATTYAINQWPTLEVFLDDGRVPLSNAHVERQQRRTALGRKNYLFAGNDRGARRLAILQTVVVNCDLLGISMWHYLRDVFQRLADGWPRSRTAELTPAAWAAAQKKSEQPDAQ
jgi:transposase